MLDFVDAAGNEAYNDDDVHHEVGEYNASICRAELTARVDWNYDGEPLINARPRAPLGDVRLGATTPTTPPRTRP